MNTSCAQQPATEAKQAAPSPGYIDAHVHVWTPDLEKYPIAAGFKREDMQPPSFTPEELLAHARPCGVDRIVLIQMSFYRFDNSYMLDTIRRFPGVFSGVAVIDEAGKDPAAEMRALKPQGVRGFRIRPEQRSRETWLDGPGMAAMWRCGAEERLAMCHLVDPDSLPAIERMCAKHPDTPVVIDHFARIGVDGQIREADVNSLCRLARHKNTSVKVSAFYALGKKQPPYLDLAPMIRRLLDAFGRERSDVGHRLSLPDPAGAHLLPFHRADSRPPRLPHRRRPPMATAQDGRAGVLQLGFNRRLRLSGMNR